MKSDIALDLPSDLHDALLQTLTFDYSARRATLALRLSIGDPHGETEADREAHQAVTLTISGLLWCVIEAPRTDDDAADAEELWIDAGRIEDLKIRPNVPAAPEGSLAWWIFVQQWNAFIYIAGKSAAVASDGVDLRAL